MSSSRDEYGIRNTVDRSTAGQAKRVKPVGTDQRTELSPARGERKPSAGNCATLDERPDADPHVRWCERGRFAVSSYSIVNGELQAPG